MGTRIQLMPNYIRQERRICLTRIRWDRGVVGDGMGYSSKLSVSLCWKWQGLWIGLFIKSRVYGWYAWVCLLPCLPIRFSYQRSYGGVFP